MADQEQSTLTLKNGHHLPRIGLGTFQATQQGLVGSAVKYAVKAGYRLIDCASGYGNQKEIGAALKELFEEGAVKREDLFIVSKLFQTHHAGTQHEDGDRRCVESLDETLEDLGLDYLDLYLIHWPFGFQEKKLDDSEGIKQPLRLGDGSPNPIWNIKMEYLDTWRCFEKFVANGKCKSIGVSNFAEEQLQQIIDTCTIPPAVNQIEVHPYLLQPSLHSYCAEKNIRVMGYSPLGSTSSNHPQKYGVNLLSNPVIKVIAEKLGKTAAQILIKWTTQNNSNLITIPKSTTPSRIVENISLDFEIENEDVKKINELDCGHRYFISYLKKPGNDNIWHSGVIEEGNDDDWVR